MSSDAPSNAEPNPSRRQMLQSLALAGVGSAVFQRALVAQVDGQGRVTPEMIDQAAWIADLSLSDEERQRAAGALQGRLADFGQMRAVSIDHGVPPAVYFTPAPTAPPAERARIDVRPIETDPPARPQDESALAFMPVVELAALIRARKVTSRELTELYLGRLGRYDSLLKCVITITEDLALKQAERADQEIAAGRYRGPLHGIPWGAKDLIAVPGYKTTWGAGHFQDQQLKQTATVARRLEQAGAVLVAKLTLGALAWGDIWYGGTTRNPWNPEQGSSGSSAGSASATAAGLVGFSIGSETLGSIISPSKRCGNSSLRPTFGRVSRHGCMTLAWTMDKLGPICRSIEDCALVLGAIAGRDGQDPTAVDADFRWPCPSDVSTLRVGYIDGPQKRPELEVLEKLGVTLVPIKLPNRLPVNAMTMILSTEAATVFDDLTRSGIREGIGRWETNFRQAQFIPAVEYLRANRIRTLLIREMDVLMKDLDAYVGGNDLAITNLTGHPTAVMPGGFHQRGEATLPYSVTMTGKLFGESKLLALAHAYQQATTHHLQQPPLDKWLPATDP